MSRAELEVRKVKFNFSTYVVSTQCYTGLTYEFYGRVFRLFRGARHQLGSNTNRLESQVDGILMKNPKS